MTLQELITAITQPKIVISVLDSNDEELIKFYTGGQSQLASSLLSREVDNIRVDNATTITIILKGTV